MREDAAERVIGATTFALHDADNAGTSADVVAWPADTAHASFHIADGIRPLATTICPSMATSTTSMRRRPSPSPMRLAYRSMTPAHCTPSNPYVSPAVWNSSANPQSNTLAIVDYAHNYASVTALLDFVYERWGEENPRITLVTGSAGNKAYDRRKEIVEAAENRIANFIFTAEDTDTEPFIDICMEMQGYITNKDVASTVISDRPTAITNAIYDARAHADRFNILLIIGKGNERWIKDHHKHVPFDGDDHVVEACLACDGIPANQIMYWIPIGPHQITRNTTKPETRHTDTNEKG